MQMVLLHDGSSWGLRHTAGGRAADSSTAARLCNKNTVGAADVSSDK